MDVDAGFDRYLSTLVANNMLTAASSFTYLVQLAADSTSLLDSKVKGSVFLALVELAQVCALLLVHDSEHTSDVLAKGVDAQDLAGRAAGNLLNTQVEQLSLELLKLLLQVRLGLCLQFECLDLNLYACKKCKLRIQRKYAMTMQSTTSGHLAFCCHSRRRCCWVTVVTRSTGQHLTERCWRRTQLLLKVDVLEC